MLVKKVTNFREFGYLNSSCIRKKYYYNAFVAQFSDRCFGWLPAAMPISLAWRLHTNLYKFGGKVSPRILLKQNCCDLNLGESLCIFSFLLFSDYGLNLWNGFYNLFIFDLF